MKPMRRIVLVLTLTATAFAACPQSIKCTYHNHYYVPKVDTEYRNGKQFGVYEHNYIDTTGKNRKCRLLLECS